MSRVVLWVHCVWGTKSRYPHLTGMNRSDILAHIKSNATLKGIYIDFINAGMDHIHCLLSLEPDQSVGKVMNLINGESARWINKNLPVEGRFEWGDEFYAASISYTRVDRVRDYIRDQDHHHAGESWEDEERRFARVMLRGAPPGRDAPTAGTAPMADSALKDGASHD